MTTYTLVPAGHRGMDAGVQAVVAGGRGDKQATGGELVATLQPGWWRERALAVVDDEEWVYGKETGDLGGRLRVDPEHTARLRAVRASFWSSRYDLDLEGTPAQVKGTRNRVWTADGQQLGTSGHIGWWSPVLTLTLRDDLPVAGAVFLLWLEWLLARRRAAGWRLQQTV